MDTVGRQRQGQGQHSRLQHLADEILAGIAVPSPSGKPGPAKRQARAGAATAFRPTTARRIRITTRVASLLVALLALAGAAHIITTQGSGSATATPAVSQPTTAARNVSRAVPTTAEQRGTAMGIKLRTAGLPTTSFACDAALTQSLRREPTLAPAKAAQTQFVNACMS